MNEEEIKKQMQQRIEKQIIQSRIQEIQTKETEKMLKNIASKILDRKAYERLMNLKLVKPDLALQLELYFAQLYQTGQLKTKITEAQFVEILKKVSEKKEFRIKRK